MSEEERYARREATLLARNLVAGVLAIRFAKSKDLTEMEVLNSLMADVLLGRAMREEVEGIVQMRTEVSAAIARGVPPTPEVECPACGSLGTTGCTC